MDASILIAFITPALFYLGARAKLTQPIHSRYPAWLVGFMNCAACAGAWYAMLTALAFHLGGWTIFGSTTWLTIPAAGLVSIWWTPIAVDLQERALMNLAASGDNYEDPPPIQVDLAALRVDLRNLATAAAKAARRTGDLQARTALRKAAEGADAAADAIDSSDPSGRVSGL